MLYFIGQVLPYISVTIFVLGMAWRIGTWFKAPVPFQITIFPAPKSGSGRIGAIAKELFMFTSLWRGDRTLWFWGWVMHLTLAMIIIGHVVGICYLTHQFTLIGLSEAASSQLSASLGIVSGIGFFVALIVLFYRRTAVPELKRLSDPADYFDLLLLLSIVVTGMHMRLTTHEVNLSAVRQCMGSLITLNPTQLPNDWIFASHFFLVNLLLIYFPFSKMVHLAGFFVTRAMLSEAAPTYPTPSGVSRDASVLKRRKND